MEMGITAAVGIYWSATRILKYKVAGPAELGAQGAQLRTHFFR